MESTSGEDTVKIVEMITKGLEYYIYLADEITGELERGAITIKSNPITAGWVTHKLENTYTTEVHPLE